MEVYYMSLKVKEIEEEDSGPEKLWIEEAKHRYQKYKEGKIKANQAETVFKEARLKVK